MDNTSFQMLGCQLRIPVSGLPALWPTDRREGYLLCPTIDYPLSADSSVWPGVKGDPALGQLFEDYTGGQFEAPNGLNVFRLRRDFRLALDALRDDQGHLVALSVKHTAAQKLISRHAIVHTDHNERACSTVPTYGLGYDVCDETLLSVLMNCGVSLGERARLRATFTSALNRHGLFDAPVDAEAFSATMAQVVPEHAPLVVVHLKTIGKRL